MEKLDTLELYNDDCFNVFPQLEEKSINLFVLDLPYNQTACSWDKDIIPLDKMWEHIKRIMKPNGIIIMFCTAKFGYRLIHSNPKWFRYDLIWKKSRKVGFLSANKMPLRQHENIYLFKPEQGTYHPQKTEGTPYKCRRGSTGYYTTKGENYEKNALTENKGDRHPTSIIDHENLYVFKPEQGTYHPQKTEGHKPYKDDVRKKPKNCGAYGNEIKANPIVNKGERHPTSIIEQKDLGMIEGGYYRGEGKKPFKRMAAHPTERHPTSIIDHENLYVFSDNHITHCKNGKYGTYNPQKTEGKPYKVKGGKSKNVNGSLSRGHEVISQPIENKGDRHPTSLIDYDGDSILIYKNPHKTIHRTQKPVELLEWLIKTYSNEEETVMDFTMGSGTAAIACLNTNRKFIGVEKDQEIFHKAEDRIAEHIMN